MMKITNVRLKIFINTVPCDKFVYFFCEKLIALPTANKKDGKIKSVSVNPLHCACISGEKGVTPLPGVFTIIIKHIVIPRKISSDKKRIFGLISIKIGKGKVYVCCLLYT